MQIVLRGRPYDMDDIDGFTIVDDTLDIIVHLYDDDVVVVTYPNERDKIKACEYIEHMVHIYTLALSRKPRVQSPVAVVDHSKHVRQGCG